MSEIARSGLRTILETRTLSDLERLWSYLHNCDKRHIIEEIMDFGDRNLEECMAEAFGWDFKIVKESTNDLSN